MGVLFFWEFMGVVGDVLKVNIIMLGFFVFLFFEQFLFFVILVVRKFLNMKVKFYIFDFKLVFDYFCIYVGGRVVFDEIEKNLSFFQWYMEFFWMIFYRFGNIFSSLFWYEFVYMEVKGRVCCGDKVW